MSFIRFSSVAGIKPVFNALSAIFSQKICIAIWLYCRLSCVRFEQGVSASLLAPTALNKQEYMIIGKGHEVEIRNDNGIFTGVNRGLIRYHFELGADKENFHWAA